MTDANLYVLNNWDKYGDFESREECEHFLTCCEAYDTSYEVAHEQPEECYEFFGFVWTDIYEYPTTRDCIEAITEYSILYKNRTVEDVAREIATVWYEDDKVFYDEYEHGTTVGDITKEIINHEHGCDVIQVGSDVLYRVYC